MTSHGASERVAEDPRSREAEQAADHEQRRDDRTDHLGGAGHRANVLARFDLMANSSRSCEPYDSDTAVNMNARWKKTSSRPSDTCDSPTTVETAPAMLVSGGGGSLDFFDHLRPRLLAV